MIHHKTSPMCLRTFRGCSSIGATEIPRNSLLSRRKSNRPFSPLLTMPGQSTCELASIGRSGRRQFTSLPLPFKICIKGDEMSASASHSSQDLHRIRDSTPTPTLNMNNPILILLLVALAAAAVQARSIHDFDSAEW